MLLGLVCLAVCGAATAKPPLSEGREQNPVVRDFQLGEPPAAIESFAPSPTSEKSGDMFGWLLVVALHEAIMDRLTIPLGTAQADQVR